MNADFINLSAAIRNEYLLKTEVLVAAQNQQRLADFAGHFQSVCAEIVKLQNEASLPAISYIDYTMLYTNFIARKYVAEVWVYGHDWYCDKSQRMVGEYDLSFLFAYFDELWNKLLTTRKRYVGKVTAQDVKTIMVQTLPDFYSYFVKIVRSAVKGLIDQKPFTDIAKNETFRLSVGDYMAKTKPVYAENKNKDAEALAEWFEEQLEKEYAFNDYSRLDFSGRSFMSAKFHYALFRYSCMNKVSFRYSVLNGVNFYKAQMEDCCLENCSIYEADFSYAILKNANFINAYGPAGLPNEKEWRHAGFLPISFRYADLTNVDFRGADLTGADFTGAILDGAILDDTILDGAIFDDGIRKG